MKEGIRQTYIDVHDLTLLEKKTGDSKWEKVETAWDYFASFHPMATGPETGMVKRIPFFVSVTSG